VKRAAECRLRRENVAVIGPEAREKFLCAFRVAKAAHCDARVSRVGWWLFLCAVCSVGRPPFDEPRASRSQVPGSRAFGRRIAAQLIGDDLARVPGLERSTRLKKTFGRGFGRAAFCSKMSSSAPCSSTARHSRCGSPRSVTNISSRCHVLPGLRRARFDPVSEALAKLIAPASDCLVCHGHTAPRRAVPRCRASSN